MIPASWVPYIEAVVIGLGGALAATGIYDLFRRSVFVLADAMAGRPVKRGPGW